MATRHSRDNINPLKKKFVSPNANRKSPKFSNISPKCRTNLKEFCKHPPGKKEGNLKKKMYEMKKEKREKYHLGGNSSDPLNLNSLINRDPNFSTPQASPHPAHGDSPISISYAPHEDDPLNLKGFPDMDVKEGITPKKKKKRKSKGTQNDIENKVDKDENKVESSKDKKKKKKHKKLKDNIEKVKEEKKPDEVKSVKTEKRTHQKGSEQSENIVEEPPPKKKCKESAKSSDLAIKSEEGHPIVVSTAAQKIEQNICEEKPKKRTSKEPQIDSHMKPGTKKAKVFIYGNYNRYYNYRNPQYAEDLRLKIFSIDWFAGKDVLDIGCNVGDITIFIAKHFKPRIIIGNDIDNSLIKIAKSKCQATTEFASSVPVVGGNKKFPMSFGITNGPIAVPKLLHKDGKTDFPHNIIFKQENYVPPDDRCLANQKPMFDTVLCLSVTKWVHLNWGDQGLKRMFKKIYKNLRPGGRLVLEPQPFASYKKRRKLSDKIRANYDNISLRPENFIDYLLSEEVGFVAYEVLEEQQHGVPGFRRPIYLFTKANEQQS